MSRPELTTVRNDATRDHDVVAPLLAWYVNESLGAIETRRVETHLAVCATCRADEALERSLARSIRETPSVELAPQAGLAAVMDRIERREMRRRFWSWPLRLLRGEGALRPLVLAVGIQAVVIVMLTGVLWIKLAPATYRAGTYRALSTPPAPASAREGVQLRLVLADDLSLGQLREALAPWGSRIVGGPEGRGIYTISIEGDADAALAALRATPGVNLVEPVTAP